MPSLQAHKLGMWRSSVAPAADPEQLLLPAGAVYQSGTLVRQSHNAAHDMLDR